MTRRWCPECAARRVVYMARFMYMAVRFRVPPVPPLRHRLRRTWSFGQAFCDELERTCACRRRQSEDVATGEQRD